MTGSYQIKRDAFRRGEHLGACVAAGPGEGGEGWQNKTQGRVWGCFGGGGFLSLRLEPSGKTTCSVSSEFRLQTLNSEPMQKAGERFPLWGKPWLRSFLRC